MGNDGRDDAKPDVSQALATAPASRVRYAVLAAACSLAMISYVHRIGFASEAPQIQKDLNLGEAQMGYLMAAFLLGYSLLQVPGGMLGDRIGARHVLTVLTLGWSVMTGAVALLVPVPALPVVPFIALLVLRSLFGALQAPTFPAFTRVVADWMPVQERASAQGLIWTCTRLGAALSPFLMAALVALCGTWRTPLWILTGISGLWCLAFWPWFRDKPEEMARVNHQELALIASGRRTVPAVRGSVPWSRLFRSTSAWALCLQYGIGGIAGNFFYTLLPLYLKNQRQLPDHTVMWLTGLPLACGVASCTVGGLLSDAMIRARGNNRWARALFASSGRGLAGLAFLATIWVQNPWILGFLFCAMIFLNDLSAGPAWAACVDLTEQHAGVLSGVMNTMGSVGGALGNVLAGHLFESGHADALFVIFAVSLGAASLCWLAVDVTKPVEG